MCFSVSTEIEAYERQRMFYERIDAQIRDYDKEHGFVPSFFISGFTYPQLPVITSEAPEKVSLYHWGLIPYWVKDHEQAADMRSKTLNAKSETVFEKPAFRASIMKKRCLVLVTGFYEWQTIGKLKVPWFIYPKEGGYFALGGIYEHWTDRETGEILHTFSILTTPSNPMMSRIHNSKLRMPLILAKGDENRWLDRSLTKEEVVRLMVPCEERLLSAHTISKRITSRREDPDSPEVQRPFVYEGVPARYE